MIVELTEVPYFQPRDWVCNLFYEKLQRRFSCRRKTVPAQLQRAGEGERENMGVPITCQAVKATNGMPPAQV
jgi:hypothetical protein